MKHIDEILSSIDVSQKALLKESIERYLKYGDKESKSTVLRILKEADSTEVRKLICLL